MKKNNQAAIVFGLCAAYFICYFTKLSPSAVMPIIQDELDLSSSQIGFISGIYFFSYAVMQFFTGSLCRRFTAQKVIMVGMFLAAVGLGIFASADNFVLLATGRFLIGLGISPIFVGLIYFFQQCYHGDEYVKAFGIIIIVGNISSLCASTPLKALLSVVDRNVVFTVITIASLAVGVFLAIVSSLAKDQGKQITHEPVLENIKTDFLCIIHTPVLRCVLLYWFIESAMLMSYQALWCMKWSSIAFPSFSGIASFSGVAVSLGVILSGKFGDTVLKGKTRGIKCNKSGWLSFSSIIAIIVIKILFESILTSIISLVFDFIYGFAAGSIVLHAGALARESTDASRNAGIMGVVNGCGCFVQQMSQWGTGIGVDVFSAKLSLNASFGLTYCIFGLLALIIVLYSRKTLIQRDKK